MDLVYGQKDIEPSTVFSGLDLDFPTLPYRFKAGKDPTYKTYPFDIKIPKDLNYQTLEPQVRAKYLEWLSGKRASFHLPILKYLYLSGLERSSLIDQHVDDDLDDILKEILNELNRITSLPLDTRFRQQCNHLKLFLKFKLNPQFHLQYDYRFLEKIIKLDTIRSYKSYNYSCLRFICSMLLSKYAYENKSLPADFAYIVAHIIFHDNLPKTQYKSEVSQVFKDLYALEYGEGISLGILK